MRTLRRTAVSIAAAVVVSAALALPASAGQPIEYRGDTSAPAPNRVFASVLKRESGRRILNFIGLRSTLPCEDASTQQSNVVIGIGRLGEGGSFGGRSTIVTAHVSRVDGTIGFRRGSGTALFNKAELTQDGTDAQLCTTGELTWTVVRTDSEPVKPSAVDIPGGKRYLRVRSSGGDR